MPLHEHDETWPYLEKFNRAHVVDQQRGLCSPPVLQNMGLRLERVERDFTRLSIAPPSEVGQPKGAWQGGILATLVDTAAEQALRTTLKSDHDVITVHLDTKYFLPWSDERVFAQGSVVRKGRNLAHIDVAVVKDEGALVARGWCVLKLLRRAEPARTEKNLPAPAAVPLRDCESPEAARAFEARNHLPVRRKTDRRS
jgi:uncharacterized protein (TIGR00369 family)